MNKNVQKQPEFVKKPIENNHELSRQKEKTKFMKIDGSESNTFALQR